MTSREIVHEIQVKHLLDAAVVSATTTSPAVDTQGWEALMFVWDVGVWTAGTFQLSLTECATLAGTYTPVADVNMEFFASDASGKIQRLGTGLASSPIVSSVTSDQMVIECSYVAGTMRYVKAVLTGVAGSAGMALLAIQGRPRETVGFA